MANDQGSGGQVLLGFVIGAAVGAAAALLFAPASGEETRRNLGRKAKEGREKAETLVHDGADFLRRQREKVTVAAERGREAFDQARQEPL